MAVDRREVLRLAAATAVASFATASAKAQGYPARPVRIVVGFPAGFTPDIVARLLVQSLSARLGQQFIVENRPGAASNIATEGVARSSPDGYTLLFETATNATNATFYDNLAFDLLRDIAPVASVFRSPLVLEVNPAVPAETLPEFVAYAKANPGKINYASSGIGSAPNVTGELFKIMAGVDLVHVPYKSNFYPDLLGGQVQAAFALIAGGVEFIRAGKLRALAVTGTSRSETLPDIPTVAELLPGYESYIWEGIGAPRDTPPEIVEKLNREINAALAEPELRSKFAGLGGEPVLMTPIEFRKYIAAEIEKWGKVIRAANMKPE